MKISLRWLREFFPHELGPEPIANALINTGVEVAGTSRAGVNVEKIIVAQIASVEPHPNADRLSVCLVNDGSDQLRQIVCGATNFQVSDKVPLALPGAVLPNALRIRNSKIRGVQSEGMLCSARELDLAEDAAGLLILSPDAVIGEPLASLYPEDTILDLEITPDRPDLLSYHGIARELSAIFSLPAEIKLPHVPEPSDWVRDPALVRIEDRQACPFIAFREIREIRVGASPEWLRRRLEASGVRAINNIVDATNYVMLETGKPLHAYDLEAVDGGIQVRFARSGESLVALDGKTYELTPEQLVIADAQKLLGLGGVMGGDATGVSERTRSILLESALFSPPLIRRMSRGLSLLSEASYRFERGVDPRSAVPASQRCAELILQLAAGQIDEALRVDGAEAGPRQSIRLRPIRCVQVLGTADADPDKILPRIGLQKLGPETWLVPSYRLDLREEIDLIEEVCRIYGIEKVAGRTVGAATPSSPTDREHDRRMELRRKLVGFGLFEAKTLAFIDEPALAQAFRPAIEPFRLRNPLAEDQNILRPSLIPGLIRAAERNFQRSSNSVRLFELGKVFQKSKVEERMLLGMIVSGQAKPRTWDGPPVVYDFFGLKGLITAITNAETNLERSDPTDFLALICRVSLANGTSIGYAGQVRPALAKDLGARDGIFVAELDFEALPRKAAFSFRPLDRYPAVTRDVAFLIDEKVPFASVRELLQSAQEPLLVAIDLFDFFVDPEGRKVPPGQKSLALSLTYRSPDRTLTQDEVNAGHQRLKSLLVAHLKARLRE